MERVDVPVDKDPPPSSRRSPGFGEVDLDAMASPAYERPRPFLPKDRPKIRPSPNETPTRPRGIEAVKSMHRLAEPPKDRPTQQSLEAVKLAEQESRIARAKLGSATVPPPPSTRPSTAPEKLAGSGALDPLADDDEDPIAAMRAMYAQGDAAGALALATSLTAELDEPADLEPASGTFGAASGAPMEPAPFADGLIALDEDPFGGLIPVDDESLDDLGDLDLGDDPFGGLEPVEPMPLEPLSHSAIVAAGSLPLVTVQTPHLLIDAREIPSLPIDPRAAFLLTLVDGIQSLEEILDICAMPQAEALDLIEKLRTMGVIDI